MLFALPDDPPSKNTSATENVKAGVELDTDLSSHEFLNNKKEYDAMAKVELDLEGAPFLTEEEHPEDKKKKDADSQLLVIKDTSDEKKVWSDAHPVLAKILNPKVSIPLLIIIIAAFSYLFFVRKDAPPAPPPIAEKDQTTVPESVAQSEKTQEYAVSFEPFWVEQTDAEGNIRFLIFKFSASSKDEKVRWEANNKILLLRDAVFYYLRHKNLTFLSDKENVTIMKQDLLGILNGHLSTGMMDTLHIESYLVK